MGVGVIVGVRVMVGVGVMEGVRVGVAVATGVKVGEEVKVRLGVGEEGSIVAEAVPGERSLGAMDVRVPAGTLQALKTSPIRTNEMMSRVFIRLTPLS